MNIKLFIAIIGATAGLVLGYINCISNFISLAICMIAFLSAILLSIKDFFDAYNATQTRNDETTKFFILSIQEEVKNGIDALFAKQSENFDNLNANLTQNKDSIIKEVKVMAETYTNIVNSLKSLETGINSNTATSENLTSNLETFNSNIDGLSTEIKTHFDSFNANSEKMFAVLKSHLDTFYSSSEKISNDLQTHLNISISSVNNILTEFRNKSIDLNNNFKEIIGTIESFSRDVNELKETHGKFASEISNVSNSNKRFVEDLEEKIEEFLERETESLQQSNEDLSDSMETHISNITGSIKSLTSSMQSGIGNLMLDIKDLCDAVTAINNKTQDIDKADKDLLEKISKICK